jgi:hypothetical protein
MGNFLWVLLIFVAAFLTLMLYWQREINIPHLTFTALPPYDVPDVILVGGVIVENRGRAPAHNVKVEVSYDAEGSVRIQHMHVESEEPYILRGGGEQFNFATIRLRELRPHNKLFLYWAAGQEFKPRIHVTSYQPSQTDVLASWRDVTLAAWQRLRERFH